MSFYRGFLIWGITVILIATLCFILWKYYFCRVRGFENRKTTSLAGCVLIFVSSITYLFLPLVLCKSSLFTQTKNRFVDGIKNDIVSRTRNAFYEDADVVISEIVDSIIGNSQIAELEQAKETVVEFALKYSKNRTLKVSLENAFKILKTNDFGFEYNSDVISNIVLEECNKIVENCSSEIKKDYIQNSLMKVWVAPIVENVSMEDFTGIVSDEVSVAAFNKAKEAFDKLFLNFAICLSLITAAVIFVIIYLLREKEDKVEEKYKRSYMFEYNEKSLEEMNTKKA